MQAMSDNVLQTVLTNRYFDYGFAIGSKILECGVSSQYPNSLLTEFSENNDNQNKALERNSKIYYYTKLVLFACCQYWNFKYGNPGIIQWVGKFLVINDTVRSISLVSSWNARICRGE